MDSTSSNFYNGYPSIIDYTNYQDENDTSDFSSEYSSIPGFHFGVFFDIPFNDKLSFVQGFFLATKGSKETLTDRNTILENKMTLFFLDIPAVIKGRFKVNDNFNIFGAAGPVASVGIIGIIKETQTKNKRETKYYDILELDTEGDLKALDFGLTLGGGIEYKSFLLGISYDFGLLNMSAYPEKGFTIKNRI